MAKDIMEKRTNRKQKPLGQIAVEKPHKEPKDNLTLDVLDAQQAGMSYGQYKAQHPTTRYINEPRLGAKRSTPAPPKVYEFVCRGCGEKFTTTTKMRRYCGDGCKAKKANADYHAKKAKAMEEVQVCV